MNSIAAKPAELTQDLYDVSPLTGTFGAQINGIDLSVPLGEAGARHIRELLRQYKVLVFRDQFSVGPKELLAFAEHFGVPEAGEHPTHASVPGLPGVKVLHSNAEGLEALNPDSWHTDGSTRKLTRCLSILQAIDIPPFGRDTLFADMEAVYDRLSKPMRTLLDGLTAEHSWKSQKPGAPTVMHPVVLQDEVNGRKALYVNKTYTCSINEMRPDESEAMLQFLYRQTHVPEIQLRVNWKPGSIVMWDNEKTQHYLVFDKAYNRIMHRVMLFDDILS